MQLFLKERALLTGGGIIQTMWAAHRASLALHGQPQDYGIRRGITLECQYLVDVQSL